MQCITEDSKVYNVDFTKAINGKLEIDFGDGVHFYGEVISLDDKPVYKGMIDIGKIGPELTPQSLYKETFCADFSLPKTKKECTCSNNQLLWGGCNCGFFKQESL